MTKEQEDSIEILENTDISTIELAENTDLYTYSIAVKNVLNMLKENSAEIHQKNTELAEKNAEIERLRKHNKELLRKLRNRVKEVKKLQKNPNYKAIVTKQGKTLEERAEQIKKYKQLYNKALDDAVITAHDNMKKDKMIDLLVNKLNQNCKVFENSEIKEIVEIYEKIKSTSNLRGIEVRKECIKQYFERKVEDECKR